MVCRGTGRGRLFQLQLCEEEDRPGHTIQDVDGDCFVHAYLQYGAAKGWLEEGCHRLLLWCISTASDCS